MDVPLPEEQVSISNNAVSFHLQGVLNVHAHDLAMGIPASKQFTTHVLIIGEICVAYRARSAVQTSP
jgi:hypothetical protein